MTEPTYLEELFSLAGKAALVTGASGGIGQELAFGLSRAGARVAISGRAEDRLAQVRERIEEAGGEVSVVPADLSDLDSCVRMVELAAAQMGGLDILVNCAGMNRRQPILDVKPAVYEEILTVNLGGPYFASQAAVPHLRERGGGSIIHIGSLTSAVALSTVSVYGATKAALAQLTKTQAVEWAEYGIRVNCLCPGFILTPLTEKPLWGNESKRRWMLDRIPLKRPGSPEEMVGAVIYVASPAASYLTGQSIYLDGGFLAGSAW